MKIGQRMKNINKKIDDLIKLQKDISSDYSKVVNDYESEDFGAKYEDLKEEFEIFREKQKEIEVENRELEDENSNLKLSLKELALSEKSNIVSISKKKLKTYFENSENNVVDRLTQFEEKVYARCDKIRKKSQILLEEEKNELEEKMEALSFELAKKIENEKARVKRENKKVYDKSDEILTEIQNEGLDKETLEKRANQNRLELIFGLNWLNKIGMIMVLLGVISAFKYSSMNWFNDYFKGGSFFLLGGAFLVGGEWFYRKKRETFSLGLLGGGIAVIYSSVFYSYFLLKIMDIYTAFIVAIVITLATIALSLRYNSKTVCSMGFIGGYLPLIAYFTGGFEVNEKIVITAMVYVGLLNITTLIISFYRRWIVVNYISYITHIPVMVFFISVLKNRNTEISYVLFTYVLYLVVTLIYPLRYKIYLNKYDKALVGLNTISGFSILYFLIDKGYRGGVALLFSIIYILIGKLVEKKTEEKEDTLVLYFGTALTFAFLVIPIQFGIEWLAMGWFVEGLVIAYYGKKRENKKLFYSGIAIFSACLIAFYGHDMPLEMDRGKFLFDFKFALVTFGEILLLFLLYKNSILKNRKELIYREVLKYVTLLSVWCFEIYIIDRIFHLKGNFYINNMLTMIFTSMAFCGSLSIAGGDVNAAAWIIISHGCN